MSAPKVRTYQQPPDLREWAEVWDYTVDPPRQYWERVRTEADWDAAQAEFVIEDRQMTHDRRIG